MNLFCIIQILDSWQTLNNIYSGYRHISHLCLINPTYAQWIHADIIKILDLGQISNHTSTLWSNMHTCLYSVNSAQTRRPLSARARRGGAFTADDQPGLAGTATRIRRHGPLAPVSRRRREDLWPFSAASGASRASDFDLLASLHGKSRSTRTSALPALLYGGD